MSQRERKSGLARLFAGVLGLPGAVPSPVRKEQVSRILLIRIDERVGNVLLTTPLIRALARHFPSAELEVLVSAPKMPLIGDLARAIPFRKKDFFLHPLRFLKQLRALRKRRYDLAIDASHWDVFSLTSALLLGLTRARWRVAHGRGEAGLFATQLAAPPSKREHDARTKLRLLEPLGISEEDTRTDTSLRSTPRPPSVLSWLETQRLPAERLVGLLPGARKLDRRAPVGVFAAIGLGLRARGMRPVVVYGPGEESLAATLGWAMGAPLAPPTNLEELAALLSGLDAVVTNDTGPMHLAVALGVPTVSLFLHDDLSRWGYQTAPHAALPLIQLGEEETVQRALSILEQVTLRPGGVD